MTRGRTVTVVLVGVGAVVVPLVLVVLGLRAVLPSSDRARTAAQEAADRVAPGQVQVTSARWRGEAGGYQVSATLADPPTSFGWTGDKRCAPGSVCEERLRVALATVRDGTRERAAIERAFSSCGVPLLRVRDVGYDTTAMLVGRRDLLASVTAVVPVAELDGPARGRSAARLDACARAWAGGRDGLLPVGSGTMRFELAGGDGAVHGTTQARVGDGQVQESAGDRMSPVRGQDEYRAFLAAIDAPVHAYLQGQGISVRRVESVRSFYAADTTGRLDIEVTVSQDSPDPVAPLPTRSLVLTVDADGRNPAGMRLVS